MLHMDDEEMKVLLKKYKLVPQALENETEVQKNVVKNLTLCLSIRQRIRLSCLRRI